MSGDDVPDRLPLSWRCSPPGLRTIGDSFVDAVLTVDAAALWAEFGEGPLPEAGPDHVNGLRSTSLRFSVPAHARVVPLSLLAGADRQWALPDMAWPDHVHVAIRISLRLDHLPRDALIVPLVRVRLTADAVSGDGADTSTAVCSLALGLPLLGEDKWRNTPGDPEAATMIERLRGRPPLLARTGSGGKAVA